MKTVELVTRKGCHLCDAALAELDLLRAAHPFHLKTTHLEEHPEFMAEFGNDIPVILVEGKEVCRHRIDRDALVRRLTGNESKQAR